MVAESEPASVLLSVAVEPTRNICLRDDWARDRDESSADDTPHGRVQLDGEPFPALDHVKVTTRAECTASASDHRGAEVLDVGEPTVDIDQLVVHERVHCVELDPAARA